MRATAFLAMAILLAASAVGATPPIAAPLAKPTRVAHVALGPIAVLNRNTNARGVIRLYDDRGQLDREQARAFMRLAGSGSAAPADASEDDERLDVRVVQLAMRAAYHFEASSLVIVSATRPGAKGKHGTGEALDFALEGVKAPLLAAYLRGLPRAGVGIYTHPKTQYVHLDVREHSYHWIDGSPPGVSWREQLLSDPKQAARDSAWSPRSDLPE